MLWLWFHEPQGQFLSTSGVGKYGKFLNKQVEILGFQLSINIQAYSVHFIREKKNQDEKEELLTQWVQELSVSPSAGSELEGQSYPHVCEDVFSLHLPRRHPG